MASIGSTTLRYATTLQRDSEGREFPFSPPSCRHSPREFARTYSVILYSTYMIYKNFRRKIQCPPPGFFLTKSLRPSSSCSENAGSRIGIYSPCALPPSPWGGRRKKSVCVVLYRLFLHLLPQKTTGWQKVHEKRRHFYLSLLVLYT